LYPKADLVRSGAVWAALRDDPLDERGTRGGSDVPIAIFPSDLYARAGGLKLDCNHAAPFIRGMTVFFNYWSRDRSLILNGPPPLRAPTHTSQSLVFIDPNGANDYVMGNTLWTLANPCMVFWNVPNEAVTQALGLQCLPTRDRTASGPGNGLSPFTSFHFNFRSAREQVPPPNPTFEADELIVLFDVDARPTESPVQIPGVCP
jgi:hypothetical protein